ncbi:hypothetical protein [Microvirga lotononidis]|uniref:Uncharacterized protein n=1 Tax=Microvirga lotononidis TaxID=864069 RepID=I4YZP3_9HYPH|nr:hypothetical protein [Microvirga lotononidis]EIM29435.1 hypothetical protein MicloDRAFT_00019130 [Microvirga lotononidis]WQO27245.1 hypothetical protein U0023_21775 [Microvirga lotononidis]
MTPSTVMAGLVPATHVLNPQRRKGVDTRDKRGHDVGGSSANQYRRAMRKSGRVRAGWSIGTIPQIQLGLRRVRLPEPVAI